MAGLLAACDHLGRMKMQDALRAVLRPHRRYADPTGHYVASYATAWRRAGAAAVDWGLCYTLFVLAAIPLGMVQGVGRVSWEEGDFGGDPGHIVFVAAELLTAVPVVGYWFLLYPTSQTYGMRATGLRMVERKTGRGMSRLRAALRSAVTTLFGIAGYAVFLDATAWDKGEQLDERSQFLLDGCYLLFWAACVSAAVLAFSPTRRSLFDRVFGTAMLDELEAVTPKRRGPWGPLDAFDTSR